IESEVKDLTFLKDELGVIVKADALGSLEAIVNFLRKKGIPVRLADIGPVSKRDVIEAITVAEKDPLLGAILHFHVKVYPDAEELIIAKGIKTFSDPVIFNMIDGYLKWVESERLRRESAEFGSLILPCKIQVLKGYVFRRSNPAIFGVEVIEGRLKRFPLMREDGEPVGVVSGIQDRGKSLDIAYKGQQVAVSIKEAFVGRTFDEGDILYSSPSVNDVKLLKTKYLEKLSEEERRLLDEIIKIKRSKDSSFIFL
ncbi:MAG: translation initiation factor IF-2, partial [Nitrososphaeria archaeon]